MILLCRNQEIISAFRDYYEILSTGDQPGGRLSLTS